MGETLNHRKGGDAGDNAKQALIQAGIEIFGQSGFDAASTRAIAERAGVNQAMISYYFGGKEGLYVDVMQFIGTTMASRLGPVVGDVEQARRLMVDSAAPARDGYLELLGKITDRLVMIMASDETAAWARLIMREQQDPSPAFEAIYDGFMRLLLDLLAQLFAAARGGKQPTKQDHLRVVTIIGQALVFRVSNAAALRTMGWKRIGERELGEVQRMIRENVRAMVEGAT